MGSRRGWRFLFSSRRRHTRCSRDWSSDVCSSDLTKDMIPLDLGETIQRVQCPYEWSRRGRAGSYPSCAGSEQLGDRRTEWRSRALGDEANVVGLQDEEGSDSSACRDPTET